MALTTIITALSLLLMPRISRTMLKKSSQKILISETHSFLLKTKIFLLKDCTEEFPDIPAGEIKAAVSDAWKELMQSREDMHKKGEEVIQLLKG